MTTRDDILHQIAFEHLDIPSLQERKSDGLDFHSVAIWSVKAALEAAFKAGHEFKVSPESHSSGFVPFDGYEIHPVWSCGESIFTGHQPMEICEPDQAQCWSLFGYIPGQGIDCIGDFPTLAHATEILARITGQPIPIIKNRATGDRA